MVVSEWTSIFNTYRIFSGPLNLKYQKTLSQPRAIGYLEQSGSRRYSLVLYSGVMVTWDSLPEDPWSSVQERIPAPYLTNKAWYAASPLHRSPSYSRTPAGLHKLLTVQEAGSQSSTDRCGKVKR